MTAQTMTAQTCCEEFAATERTRMGRRSFLRTTAALGGAAAVTTVHGTAFTLSLIHI